MRTDTTNLETAEITVKVIADTDCGIDILKMYVDNTIHIDEEGIIRSERHEHIAQAVTDEDCIMMYTISSPIRVLGDFVVIPHYISFGRIPEWITEKYNDIGVTVTEVY